MNQFIAKSLMMAADITKMGAKETFSNNEIETLLLNHNVTESLDQ